MKEDDEEGKVKVTEQMTLRNSSCLSDVWREGSEEKREGLAYYAREERDGGREEERVEGIGREKMEG